MNCNDEATADVLNSDKNRRNECDDAAMNGAKLRAISLKAAQEREVRNKEREKNHQEYVKDTDVAIDAFVETSIKYFNDNAKRRAERGYESANIVMWRRNETVEISLQEKTKNWPLIYLIKGGRSDTFDSRADGLKPFMERLRERFNLASITVGAPKFIGNDTSVIEGFWGNEALGEPTKENGCSKDD